MFPLAVQLLSVPVLALSTSSALGGIIGTAITVVVCAAIPLTTGMAKGHVTLGIIGALIVVPIAAFPLVGCVSGLLTAVLFATIIKFLPPPNRPLLTQAEVEQEMRKVRGY